MTRSILRNAPFLWGRAVGVATCMITACGAARADPAAEAAYQAALAAYNAQNYAESVRQAEAATAADPRHWQAWQLDGNARVALGDTANAITVYRYALGINPDNPQLKAYVDQLAGGGTPVTPTTTGSAAPSAESSREVAREPDMSSGRDPRVAQKRAGLRLLYPGFAIRGFAFDKWSLEGRGAYEPGNVSAWAAGVRMSRYFWPMGPVYMYGGAEYDLAGVSTTSGLRASAMPFELYLGMEYFFRENLSLQSDIGPAWFTLRAPGDKTSSGGIEFVVNVGLTLYGTLPRWLAGGKRL